MPLSQNLLSEAINAAKDVNEESRVRATALMLTLCPAAEFPQLDRNAAKLNLSDLYENLKAKAVEVMEQDGGGAWVCKSEEAEACIARLKARIKASTTVWLIHGGRSAAWKEVGRHIERDMEMKYLEFSDPRVSHVLVTDRVTTMARTATIAVAVMSAEDSLPGGKARARQNVIHEIGLAQGYLGIDRVIILRENGIEDFTNMSGVVYISFTPEERDLELAIFNLHRELEARLQ